MSLDKAAVAATVTMTSPIGELELVALAGAIREIRLVRPFAPGGQARGPAPMPLEPAPTRPGPACDPARDPAPTRPGGPAGDAVAAGVVLGEARRQLADYFAGRRRAFELPTAAVGTAFQMSVWRALAGVGYGQTTTYSELARSIGRPHAARAVGAALARNPLPLVVPCHRVIGASGDLRGFGLGGVSIKRALLDAEAARLRPAAAGGSGAATTPRVDAAAAGPTP